MNHSQPCKACATSPRAASLTRGAAAALLLISGLSVAAEVKTWDGGATLNNWGSDNNWTDNDEPVAGDSLVFPSALIPFSGADNNYGNDTQFRSITITGSTNCSLNGNRVLLTEGITMPPGKSAQNVELDLTIKLGASQTFRGGNLELVRVDLNNHRLTFEDDFVDGGFGENVMVANRIGLRNTVGPIAGIVGTGPNSGITVESGHLVIKHPTVDYGGDTIVHGTLEIGSSTAGLINDQEGTGTRFNNSRLSLGGIGFDGKLIVRGDSEFAGGVINGGVIQLNQILQDELAILGVSAKLDFDGTLTINNVLEINDDVGHVDDYALRVRSGSVIINNASIKSVPTSSFHPLIIKDSPGPVTGRFHGVRDDGTTGPIENGQVLVTPGGRRLSIFYDGGDGNDIVVDTADVGTIFRWKGNAGTILWNDDRSWTHKPVQVELNGKPNDRNDLIFPAPEEERPILQRTSMNDFPGTRTYTRMKFEDSGYSLGGNQLQAVRLDVLYSGLGTPAAPATTTITAPMKLSEDMSVMVADANARLLLTGGMDLFGNTLTIGGGGRVVFDRPAAADLSLSGPGHLVVSMGNGGRCILADQVQISDDLTLVTGTLEVLGAMGAQGTVFQEGGTLRGAGQVSRLEATGGTIRPGDVSGVGRLIVGLSMTLEQGVSTVFRLGGTTAGTQHDQLRCHNAVTLHQPTLNITRQNGFSPTVGQQFILIDRVPTGAIVGAFANLPDEATLDFDGVRYRIDYQAGNGNDVALIVAAILGTGVERIWDGKGANNSWTTAANWAGNNAPLPGDALIFGAANAGLPVSTNTFAAGTAFDYIRIEKPGYDLGGNAFSLFKGVTLTTEGEAAVVRQQITLQAPPAGQVMLFAAQPLSSLTFAQTSTINTNGLTPELRPGSKSELIFQGVISGSGGLRKLDAGRVTLAAANTFTGNVDVLAGEARVTNPTGLGAAGGAISVSPGATLNLVSASAVTIADPVNIQGTLRSEAAAHALTGGLTLTGSPTINVKNGSLTFSAGAVAGDGLAHKTGAGELRLSSQGANTWSGALHVDQGLVTLARTSGNAAPLPPFITVGSGASTPAEMKWLFSQQVQGASAITVLSGGKLSLNNHNDLLGPLTLSGSNTPQVVTGTGVPQVDGDLTVLGGNSSATIDGNLTMRNGFASPRTWQINDGPVANDFVLTGSLAASGIITAVIKTGAGQAVLNGPMSIPNMIVQQGRVLFNGSGAATTVTLNGGIVGGTGTVGPLTTVGGSGGTVSPGASAGILHTGNLTFNPTTNVVIEINGAVAGTQYDQLDVIGTVSLGGAQLLLTVFNNPTAGQTYTIIKNDAAEAVTGTFAGLAEGATVSVSGRDFTISYHGGTGNDVVLTAASSVRVWKGGGGDNLWSNRDNWADSEAPEEGDTLVFPTGAADTVNVNDLRDDTPFAAIDLGDGYLLSGAPLVVTQSLRLVDKESKSSFDLPVTFGNRAVIETAESSYLIFADKELLDVGEGALTITAGEKSVISFQRFMSGSADLLINGPGDVEFADASEVTGSCLIERGRTFIVHTAALGANGAASPTTIAAGAELIVDAAGNIAERLTLQGKLTVRVNNAVFSGLMSLTGAPEFSVQTAGHTALISSVISGNYGTARKTGAGRLRLSGNNTCTGFMQLVTGTLAVDGQQPNSDITVQAGVLEGIGKIGTLALNGGILRPGGATAGTLTIGGDCLLELAGTVDFQTGAASDKIISQGLVIMTQPRLTVAGALPTIGSFATLVQNDSGDGIHGRFLNLPNDPSLLGNTAAVVYSLDYSGGDSDDITLTRIQPPAPEILSFAITPIPSPSGSGSTGNTVEFDLTAVPGLSYTLDASTNMQSWNSLGAFVAPAAEFTIEATDPTVFPTRYYRLRFPQ